MTRRLGGSAIACLALAAISGCRTTAPAVASSPIEPSAAPQVAAVRKKSIEPPPATLTSVLSHQPDLVVTVHPRALARDPVYGPLVRRAGELASAFAGPTNLGTTALAVVEETEEVVIAENDRGREAVIALRGVPASVDPLQVVDTAGHPIWRPVQGDVRSTSRELEPADGVSDAALFVAPGLMWVIASGAAIARVRAALFGGVGQGAFVGDETPLVSLVLPGDALPQLQHGSLAGVGESLRRIQLELTPGSQGLILGSLTYADASAAAAAEGTVIAITLAFRHRLEESVAAAKDGPAKASPKQAPRVGATLEWLGAAKVERTGPVLVVRAPIPRPWLEALSHAEVPAPAALVPRDAQ